MRATKQTRRRVLQGIGAALAASSFATFAPSLLFGAISGAIAIGRAYLSGPAGAGLTLAMLRAGIANGPVQAEDWLQREVTRNFADGDVVMVDGWMLARIEAQACALICLEAGA